ncbi:MAG: lipoate--protein ligase family protein [Lactobacillus sp.]|jgi:lipoate-protein ligase A|nr:lipoate--protein ligase family protein [Lactobacillus sp.]
METLMHRYQQNPFVVADIDYQPGDNLNSFADTNAMLRYSDQFNQPLIHFWRLTDTIILGMMDTKLPYFKTALTTLAKKDYHYFVRNSGGLAVASDAGILNVSLFLPHFKDQGIDVAYNQMVKWVKDSFASPDYPIEAYEITRSYCPGTFDLSIHGQKFGGISQRRVAGGVAVMLYLSVNGDQDYRSNALKAFYTRGLAGATTKWHFPDIDPKVMANLDSLLQRSLTVAQVKSALLTNFEANGLLSTTKRFADIAQEPEYQLYFERAHQQLVQRNQRDLPTH